MTETLDPVDQPKIDHQELAQQLIAQAKAEGVGLVGPNGLLNQLTANVLENALQAEMDEHLGYEKHEVATPFSQNSACLRCPGVSGHAHPGQSNHSRWFNFINVRAVCTGPICSSPRRNDTNTAGTPAA